MRLEKEHWFEKGTYIAKKYFHWIHRYNKKKIQKKFSVKYLEDLVFTGLNVKPYDILLFSYMCGLISFLGFLIFDLLIFLLYGNNIFNIDFFTLILMFFITLFCPLIIMILIKKYPRTYARYIKIHSLGDIPEVLSYLVMYLKLVPNLENSVKFAASESSTSLACDLRKMLWDMEIRVYHGIDDALTNFANTWGKWSDYFKRSIHLIRSSVQERSDESRLITLNRSLDVSLEGTRDMMNVFASKLHQPTMLIYSIGIMIPLAIIAMLPATAIIGLKITIFQVFFLYDVILPLFIFMYTRRILMQRPATFNPPSIPSNHPSLININKKRRLFFSVFIGFIVALPGLFFMLLPVFFPDGSSNIVINYIVDVNGLNSIFPVTLFILWGVAATVSLYCISVYYPYKKVRDEIKQIEKEFSDALFILGKRLAEDKSPEECFNYTAKTMEGSSISRVFSQTGFNLTAMHTNLKKSLFSNEYGSLKHVYSDRVKAIMRLFVEGIQKSQRAVSISIIKIADHLKALQEVENKIKDTLFQLTSTLRSTSAIFAPLIAGVTLAITKLITTIINSISDKIPSGTPLSGSSVISTVASSFSIENVRPEYFVLVVGIYIIELVVMLTRFTNGIDEGDDKSEFMYNLGRIMPVAIIVLTLTLIFSQMIFSSIVKTI